MKKEVIIKAIGPNDAFLEDEKGIVGQKMTVEYLIKDKGHPMSRKYGWHGSFITQEEIIMHDGEVFPEGGTLVFFDIDIEKV